MSAVSDTVTQRAVNMILSKYRNPPYRTPITNSTPIRTSSGSPPATTATMAEPIAAAPHTSVSQHMSPSKRKRCDIDADLTTAPTSTLLSARIHPLDEEVPPQGAESPRSKVAERLRGLDLSSSAPIGFDNHSYASEESDGERKRARRTGQLNSSSGDDNVDADNTTPASSPEPASPSLHSAPSHPFTAKQPSPAASKSPHSRPKRRLSSPPPPVDPAMIFADDGNGDNDSKQQHDDDDDGGGGSDKAKTSLRGPSTAGSKDASAASSWASSSSALLTWQPAEITGHRLDARNPDDDGEGINGLGFRPTPAIAYVRSQRRKQQVSDWKAREAREARQRRFERRKGGGGGTAATAASSPRSADGAEAAPLGMAKGRVVRFAGVS